MEKQNSEQHPSKGFSDDGEELTEGKLDGRKDGVTDGAIVDVGVEDGGEELVGAAETDGCGSPHSQTSMNESKAVHEEGSISPLKPASSSSLHVTCGCPGKTKMPLGFVTRSEPPQMLHGGSSVWAAASLCPFFG